MSDGTGALTLYTAAEVADLLRMNHQVVQRKLQAGEIPGYRIGREWRIDRQQLMEWLEQHSNQRVNDPDARVLHAYMSADGRLRAIPAQRKKRDVILRHIVTAVEPNRTYTERQLNTVLRRFHDDVATLRRELIVTRLMVRTRDGIYKRSGPTEPVIRRS